MLFSFFSKMKVLSILCITCLFLKKISTQQLDIEIVDNDSETIGFSEAVLNGLGPCNGYPEYRNLPINQNFYLGAHNAGSNVVNLQYQTKDITEMLNDGIRYLDINLCQGEQGNIVVCSDNTPSTLTWLDVLHKAFSFSKESFEQFFIININTSLDLKLLETAINKVCEVHQNTVEGVDEFEDNECQFVYTFRPERGRWSTLSDILNYKPDMAQWEGDGETVGVRTKFMLTVSESKDVLRHTVYFSPAFWRSVTPDMLHKECKVPKGGIHWQQADIDTLEFNLLDKSTCNLNDSPLNSFFNIISFNHYDQHLHYLKELEKRMMDLNYAKWTGNYALLEPPKFESKRQAIQRDEL